jgi:hypothetical protein
LTDNIDVVKLRTWVEHREPDFGGGWRASRMAVAEEQCERKTALFASYDAHVVLAAPVAVFMPAVRRRLLTARLG